MARAKLLKAREKGHFHVENPVVSPLVPCPFSRPLRPREWPPVIPVVHDRSVLSSALRVVIGCPEFLHSQAEKKAISMASSELGLGLGSQTATDPQAQTKYMLAVAKG